MSTVSVARDDVPVGVDGVDRDGEGAAGGAGGRRAGLAGGRAGCGGLAGQQGSGASLNGPALIVVAGLVFGGLAPLVTSVAVIVPVPAVFGVTPKRSGAGDERGVGRQRRVRRRWIVMATVSVRGDRVPVGVDGVDRDVERGYRRSARSACRSCRSRCPGGGLAREQELELRRRRRR